jgi:2-keto-4-pentenoate hydratase/2-oxohepta-3-ene-1,7-dioic acid hydratase in catechol pathway
MRLVNFGYPSRVGALVDGSVVDLNLAYASLISARGETRPHFVANTKLPASMHEFIYGWDDSIAASREALDYVRSKKSTPLGPSGEKLTSNARSVTLKPPIPSMSSRIFCAGGNFATHLFATRKIRDEKRGIKNPFASVDDAAKSIRDGPFWGFQKWPQGFVGDNDPVHVPRWVEYLDYECELVGYIGNVADVLSPSTAKRTIVGYSVLNDWSVRDSGAIENGEKYDPPGSLSFNLQKNIAGGTIGPALVVDEVRDPDNLRIKTIVNGRVRQDGNTREMVRKFEEMVSILSRYIELYPGDLIAGGTCAGTALEKLDVEASVHDGDVVECSVETVGSIKNKVFFDRE